jgi:alkylation response protein AidB-like acyl-CoA dehydrogenase
MDLSFTSEQDAFRAEVRGWLRGNVPALGSPDDREGFEAHRAWERTLYDAGYAGLSWPGEFGGRGADVVTQAIFEEEYLRAGAPERVNVVGQKLMAPTLFVHGTQEQRRRWLPPMLTGEEIWSQGFSEPEAGSDLAAIRTKAVGDGDALVVNGQKIWTSYGAFADWIFLLIRTEPDSERHRGLTFLACDMRTDGVDARPIVQLDGGAGFAEVFLTDVRVPADQVIGEPGDGWAVAMTTLAAERDSPARAAARYERDLAELVAALRRASLDTDPVVRDHVASLYAQVQAYRLSSLRTLSRLARAESLGADASVTKLQWSELERRLWQTAIELLGPDVLHDPSWRHRYWYARAATIYAGTSEIQRNIVAERVLGLPR